MSDTPPPRPERRQDILERIAGGAAGILLAAMMMVTVIDVVGRYILNVPFPGAFEITQMLMAAIVFAGLPHVSKRENHITIDLLDPVTPKAVVPLRNLVVNLLCAVCFALFSWRLFGLAQEALEFGDVTQYLGFPRAPIIFFGSTLCAITAIIHLGLAFNVLRARVDTDIQGAGL